MAEDFGKSTFIKVPRENKVQDEHFRYVLESHASLEYFSCFLLILEYPEVAHTTIILEKIPFFFARLKVNMKHGCKAWRGIFFSIQFL